MTRLESHSKSCAIVRIDIFLPAGGTEVGGRAAVIVWNKISGKLRLKQKIINELVENEEVYNPEVF